MNCFLKIAALCTLLGAVQAFSGEEEIVRPFIEAREKVRAQQNMLKKKKPGLPAPGMCRKPQGVLRRPTPSIRLFFLKRRE